MNLPTLKVRPFTSDQYQLDKVFYSNYYKIKGSKDSDKKPVVLDIGSHVGYSVFSFLALGAEKVYSVEINPENYKLLLENIESFQDKVIPYNFGVYRENTCLEFLKIPELKDGIYYDFSEISIVEDFNQEIEYFTQPVFTLDKIIGTYCFDDGIDILKFNTGYAELEILENTDRFIRNVQNICLETGENQERITSFLNIMKVKGFINSSVKTNEEDGKNLVFLSKGKLSDIFLV